LNSIGYLGNEFLEQGVLSKVKRFPPTTAMISAGLGYSSEDKRLLREGELIFGRGFNYVIDTRLLEK